MTTASVRSRPSRSTSAILCAVGVLVATACASENPTSADQQPEAAQTPDLVVGPVLDILPPMPSPEATGTLMVQTAQGPRAFHVWPSTVVLRDGTEQPCGADCLESLRPGATVRITTGDEYLSLPAQWDVERMSVQ